MSVLGSILVDRTLLATVRGILDPGDFYGSLHESIYLAMCSLAERGEPLDKVSLAEELRNRGMLDKIGGLAYLNSLMDTVPTTASVEYHARVVRQKATLRGMIHTGNTVAALGYESEGDVGGALVEMNRLVRELDDRHGTEDGWAGRSLAEIARDGIPPLKWDVEGILAAEDGPALLYGPPSAGKSWLALHLANCVVTGAPFLDRFQVPQTRPSAVYVNLDAGATAIERRAELLRSRHGNVRIVTPRDGWSARGFERIVSDNAGGLIILDALAAAHHPNPDQEQGEAAREFFQSLRHLFTKHGCNGVVIDHANRSGTYYGSVQKLATVRAMIQAEAVTDGPPTPNQIRVRLTCEKASEAEKFLPFDALLDFTDDGLRFSVAGSAAILETSKMRLLAKIEAEGPVTRSQVGADSGNSKRGPRCDWKQLVAERAIIATGTKIGKAELYWTPEKMRARVLTGAPLQPGLHPNDSADEEEPKSHNDSREVQR